MSAKGIHLSYLCVDAAELLEGEEEGTSRQRGPVVGARGKIAYSMGAPR